MIMANPSFNSDGYLRGDLKTLCCQHIQQRHIRPQLFSRRLLSRHSRVDRFTPVNVGFELPADGRRLSCTRLLVVTADRGEEAETLMCSEVRAGGIVFMRRGVTTYYILLDFGAADKKPSLKWNPGTVKELRERYDRSFSQEPSLQEDPPEGEPPEPPED